MTDKTIGDRDVVSEFAAVIESWHDFYMLAGSAAFTLLGLLFVAVSLNIDLIAAPRNSEDLTVFSLQTLMNFLSILLIALVFMIPEQSEYGTGIPLLFIGLLEMWRTVGLWRRFGFKGKEQRLLKRDQFQSRLLIPNTICYAALIMISAELLHGDTGLLDWMTMVVIWLLIDGSLGAWTLMLRLGEIGQNTKAER
ncbi:MAG: hypothetical protein A4E47_01266 [Methanosaeta sp. PtaU1.Bin028]|nr:MAG: hypothetical protein A4E47_01266 [Methanosaeta sp. PtaU1.Bin028]